MAQRRLPSILFMALVICCLLNPSIGSAKSRLRVGFILPLSGDWAFLGNGIRDGALLAAKDLEGSGITLDLAFEDNAGELSRSAVIASKLINVQKVDAIISIISGVGKLLKPLASNAKVINVGICSDTDVADGRYSFINYLTAEQGVAKYLDYFSRSFPEERSLGVFSLSEAGFQKIVDELKRRAAGRVEIRFVENFDRGTTDFRPLLLRAAGRKAKAFLVLGLSPEIELLVKQAKTLAITTPVTSIEGFGLAGDKSPFEGAWFIDSAVPEDGFSNRFREVYGKEVTPGVGHSYDSVMLLAEAARRCTHQKLNCSPDGLADTFRGIRDFHGSTGIVMVRRDGVIWSEASVKVIRDGRAELAAPYRLERAEQGKFR